MKKGFWYKKTKMPTLIFDIETIGEDFDRFDKTSQEVLTRWIKRETNSESEYKKELDQLKDGLGFSPLTGEIVVIGALDYEKDKGVVYFQCPDKKIRETEEKNIKYKPATEKEMLEKFWRGAQEYDTFVSFYGGSFDLPFILIRSAIHKIRPTKNLLSHRYLNSQWQGAKHIDLLDQFTFYGSVRRRHSLHLHCRAFGIKSPKAQGISGENIKEYFQTKKYLEIARYNAGDLFATKKLYEYWRDYLMS
ncbi:MAG: Uncharacterized protein CEN89_484 [Candidatus Berkelbacteria bacterium Licking1014_7]|uniref:Predicted 3'-5' exonuclease PolB-like domain-containing protein n=1 Tax=Candidatus Berkelbacteria bacterium Licking1014_7 TaxID=2017147 RepID=A0A554LIU8_9BACT|nr:MAG: Uncharacterized protein CEN89_484 [Candidatus Berkelbacteria bacterium Licking1014_7]